MKLYLAHNYGIRHTVKDTIQPKWENQFEIELFNPFADRPELYETQNSSEKYAMHIDEQQKGMTPNQIMEQDLRDILKCDGLIAYVIKSCIGTFMELFYNSYILKRKTIAVVDDPDLLYHVWLRSLTEPILYKDLTKYRFDEIYRKPVFRKGGLVNY